MDAAVLDLDGWEQEASFEPYSHAAAVARLITGGDVVDGGRGVLDKDPYDVWGKSCDAVAGAIDDDILDLGLDRCGIDPEVYLGGDRVAEVNGRVDHQAVRRGRDDHLR